MKNFLKKREARRLRLVRFGTVGILNAAIDFSILNLLVFFLGVTSGPGLVASNAVAFIAASLNSYFCNKSWTFEEKKEPSLPQYLLFLSFSVGGLAINTSAIYLLTSVYPVGGGLAPVLQVNLAKVCATLASLAWNYITYRQIVFRKSLQGRQIA